MAGAFWQWIFRNVLKNFSTEYLQVTAAKLYKYKFYNLSSFVYVLVYGERMWNA